MNRRSWGLEDWELMQEVYATPFCKHKWKFSWQSYNQHTMVIVHQCEKCLEIDVKRVKLSEK